MVLKLNENYQIMSSCKDLYITISALKCRSSGIILDLQNLTLLLPDPRSTIEKKTGASLLESATNLVLSCGVYTDPMNANFPLCLPWDTCHYR